MQDSQVCHSHCMIPIRQRNGGEQRNLKGSDESGIDPFTDARTTVDANLVRPVVSPFRHRAIYTRPITVERRIRLCGLRDRGATLRIPGL